MDPAREHMKAEAFEGLRIALISELGVPDALRWCWYRNPMFTGMLFTESVRRRFGSRPDIRVITSFLAGIRGRREKDSFPGFPCREAEALIRAALGETYFLESVKQSSFSYPEIGISVLEQIYREHSFSPDEWESLLNQAALALDEASRGTPEMNLAEDDWFAAGMHDSPFATLDGELPQAGDGKGDLPHMRIRSRSKVPAEPRTHVGRWMLATLLNRQEERRQLTKMLNNGKNTGWNRDEPAVVEIAFHFAMRRLFAEDVDVRQITEFVMDMRSRIRTNEPLDQLEAEALIRRTLGDRDVVISDISPGNRLRIRNAALAYAVRKLALGEPDIRQLILDSEENAFEWGWKPPLAELRRAVAAVASGRRRRGSSGGLAGCCSGGGVATLPNGLALRLRQL